MLSPPPAPWPDSIRAINTLPAPQKRAIYRTLIPDWVFAQFDIDSVTLTVGGHQVVYFRCPDGSSAVEISVYHRPEALYLQMADSFHNQLTVLRAAVNDPASPRFDGGRDENGQPTQLGTIRRNIPEELRAMQAGLMPGQIRRGLRVFRTGIPTFELFVKKMGHPMFFIEPLFYHNAIIFERYGFEPIETPEIEYLDVLTGKYGEDERLIYHFEDRGGRDVGLRYDLTVPLARFVATHRHELTFPFKRYHIAPVFRADRPQRGRYREFWQCDADIVGTASMLADAEAVLVSIDALSAIGMPNFVVQINHRKLLQSLAQYAGVPESEAVTIHRAVDKLAKIGRDGVIDEMTRHGIPEPAAGRVLDLVQLRGPAADVLDELSQRLGDNPLAAAGIADLRELFGYLEQSGADPQRYAAALQQAGNEDYTIVILPDANHLFQQAKTGSTSEYGELPAEFTPDFLPTIIDWLLAPF